MGCPNFVVCDATKIGESVQKGVLASTPSQVDV
jgi:hypothetical protein